MSTEFDNTAKNDNPDFGLPEGYFQKSAGALMNKIEWLEEHKEFPILSTFKNKIVFGLPENYFNSNEQKLELLDCPVLGAIEKKNLFVTPENYFENAETVALSEVIGDPETQLNFIPRQNNFKVDENYFSMNAIQIEQLLLEKRKPFRIISLFRSKIGLAAAALLVATLGLWTYNFYFKAAEVKDCGTMACIDKAELLKSKSLEGLETDELYELVNAKKLEKKLEKKSTESKKIKRADTAIGDADDYLLDEI